MESKIRIFANKLIDYIFMLLIVFSVLTLFFLMVGGLWCCITSVYSSFDINKLLKGIEFIFIAPLPLLIASAFYKMYTKVTKRAILKQECNTDFERDQVMVDLTITKYLFVSTIISTLLVILIDLIHNDRVVISYRVIIAGLVLLMILVYYINVIDKNLNHKIKDAKDNLQKRFIDQDYMKQKLDELK